MIRMIIAMLLIAGCAVGPSVNIERQVPDWRKLTIEEKVAQMIMVRVRGDFYNTESYTRKNLESMIQDRGIGGVITLLISQSQVASRFYSIWLILGVVFLLYIILLSLIDCMVFLVLSFFLL